VTGEPAAGVPREGDPLPRQRHRIEREALVRYAGASGDFNRIHWDDEFARSVGLPGVIAHGMYSLGLAARAVTTYAGGPGALRRLKVRFSAIIRPGQTLTVLGEVAEVAAGTAVIRFRAEDEQGERVLSKGEVELDLDRRPAGGTAPAPAGGRLIPPAAR
jgi:acyl dehydratase